MEIKLEKVYSRSNTLEDRRSFFCPGCGHGIAQKLISQIIDELGIREETIGVASVGCSVFMRDHLNIDWIDALHGRAPAVLTGIKHSLPEKTAFTYQGDGDLATIGINEAVHVANRGENVVIIMGNNANYGMTGGQMATTSIIGQTTTTSRGGKSIRSAGYSIRIAEILAKIPGVSYVARAALSNPTNVRFAKYALKRAFLNELYNDGLAFVEILSMCPSGWRLTPEKACIWLEENMLPFYPLGEIKTPEGGVI